MTHNQSFFVRVRPSERAHVPIARALAQTRARVHTCIHTYFFHIYNIYLYIYINRCVLILHDILLFFYTRRTEGEKGW